MLGRVWTRTWDASTKAPQLKRFVVRRWYEFFSRLDRDGQVLFMNYGYAPTPSALPTLDKADCGNRYQIEMYHRVVSQIDVRELDLLEVGSGRGGGASYVTRYLHPRTYTAVDISSRAIWFCRKYYRLPGLSFFQDDAEQLNFPSQTFDAVINIESAGHYGQLGRFLSEVRRVLRPDGYLLYADAFDSQALPTILDAFQRAGLSLCRSQDLTPQVVVALDADEARKQALFARYVPGWLTSAMREFTASPGSHQYELFASGKMMYFCALLRKELTGMEEPFFEVTRTPVPEKCGSAVPTGSPLVKAD